MRGFTTDGSTVCQIAVDGKAGLEITGRRAKGRLILQRLEQADGEGLIGKLNCPVVRAIECGTAHPHSQTEATFAILTSGDTVTEFANHDVTSQFGWSKSWSRQT